MSYPPNRQHALLRAGIFTATAVLLLLFNVQLLYAQKGGAKPSSGASSSGSYVTGFSYVLPRNYHLQYKTVKDVSVETKTPDSHVPYSLTKTVVKKAFKWTLPDAVVANNNPFKLKQIDLGRTVTFTNPNVSFDKFYYGPITENTMFLTPVVPAPTTYTTSKPEVVTAITRTIEIDTIDRYYKQRLRVAISPADSGKLMITIRNNGKFAAKADPADVHFIVYRPTNEISPAIPISETDSARNFYLTITPNGLIKDLPHYLPLSYSIFQYGAATIPFKYRFSNNRLIGGTDDPTKPFASGVTAPSESTASLNVAAYAGVKFGRTRFYNDASQTHNTVSTMLGIFAGPALYTLSANNVNYGTDMNRISSQQLALSTGAAFTVEWRSVNFGLFYGFDIPFEKTDWVYRYKPWLGFGIGFSLGMFTNANARSQVSGN